jgi:hypothetical protein
MDNLFVTKKEIHKRYDLKGSLINRQVDINSTNDLMHSKKVDYALKDGDLESNKQLFYVGVYH